MTYLSKINPKTLITEIWLPGTHDSLAYNITFNLFLRTQSLNFTEQLKSGVRVFDVRLDSFNFNCCHGIFYCKKFNGEIINFEEILIAAKQFLQENTSDFIIILVKVIPSENFKKLIEKYECLELKTLQKTIAEISGKICIINQNKYIIPKQDVFTHGVVDKIHEFKMATFNEEVLFNYSSIMGVPIVSSKIINKRLKNIILETYIPQWYMIDFIDEELINLIISKNFE